MSDPNLTPATETPNRWIPSVKTREYIYNIVLTLQPITLAYGIFTAEEGGLWVTVVGAILGFGALGLARANTPKPTDNSANSIDNSGYNG